MVSYSRVRNIYDKAFPHSWEAETFRAGKYNLSDFTPADQHPDYKLNHLPTYAQAAGSGRIPKGKKGKQASAPEVARKEDLSLKKAPSLPYASRRFFAIHSSPTPHVQSQRIVTTLPDLISATLSKSNCLLPKGFIAKVNDRGTVSLTETDPHTPASTYAPYSKAITRQLNQSFPTESSLWLAFTLVPTDIQLAIHSVRTDILPDDNNHLYSWLK